jgi:hypothetical protein
MSESGSTPGDPPEDVGGDTEMFRAFVESEHGATPPGRADQRAVGVPFRLLTLAAAVLGFLVIVWLLLR